MSRGSTLFVSAICFCCAAAAAPQARVSEITPESGFAELERLGSVAAEPAAHGDELVPGDLLSSAEEGTVVVLECPPESNNLYNLTAPFRVLVSIPEEASCHVDMLGGDLDVLAEEPTEVSVGGVEMKSVGTQYAVRVWREASEPERKLIVFDGEVEVREQQDVVKVERGRSLAFKARLAGVEVKEITDEEAERSATVYSRVDMAVARRLGAAVDDRGEMQQRLQKLHYDVLRQPDDQPKRVELAKTQLEYAVNDRAVYHLKRADAVRPETFDQYQIDRAKLASGASGANRVYLQEKLQATHETYETARAPRAAPPLTSRTTDDDLALIREGKAKKAIENLGHRFRAGKASSRDAYAYAYAYRRLRDAKRSSAWAERALRMHREDRRLSPAELRLVQRLASAG